jgi:hypothetical protein
VTIASVELIVVRTQGFASRSYTARRTGPFTLAAMIEDPMTTADLLEAWRDATRAAELAERLAKLAAESAKRADITAETAEEIATLAEGAAQAAIGAADRARGAAVDARRVVTESVSVSGDADATEIGSRQAEGVARDAYHTAEAAARARHLAGTDY